MSELKLIALDAEDLQIISAHLQDAVGRMSDIAYEQNAKRFALVLNRFDWSAVVSTNKKPQDASFERRQSALRFEQVNAVRSLKLDRSRPGEVISLLAIGFEETNAPSGTVTLHFSGGAQIALEVECIEAELVDLGAAWSTKSRPQHPGAAEEDA